MKKYLGIIIKYLLLLIVSLLVFYVLIQPITLYL